VAAVHRHIFSAHWQDDDQLILMTFCALEINVYAIRVKDFTP
jgi:hypothetical protein